MKAVVQRVKNASVSVGGNIVGHIGLGLLIFVGVCGSDGESEAELLAFKIANLRIFEDGAGKMNLSLLQTGGEALAVSQFTLCADIKKGARPSFSPAAPPEKAERLYEHFKSALRSNGVETVESGVFGADMAVKLLNDGPVTIFMDTDLWKRKDDKSV